MMTKEDITARVIQLAKDKLHINKHREAQEDIAKKARKERSKLNLKIKEAEHGIAKQINLGCKADGEQTGLLALLSKEEREEIIKQLEPYKVPKLRNHHDE